MSRPRQCKHYYYHEGLSCSQGVPLDGKTTVNAPCFPRNASIPCECREWITQEDIDAEEAEIERHFCGVFKARPAIVATGKTSGYVQCPECGNKLHFTVSEYNGHIWGKCETDHCISWME